MSTPEVLKRLHKIKTTGDEIRLRETRALEEVKEGLDGIAITVQARVTPTGRYYGAITATQISNAITELTGREPERRWIEVADPIREPRPIRHHPTLLLRNNRHHQRHRRSRRNNRRPVIPAKSGIQRPPATRPTQKNHHRTRRHNNDHHVPPKNYYPTT